MLSKLKAEKIFTFAYTTPHNLFVTIRETNYAFLYRSPIYDDLNIMCRENLEYWEKNSRLIFSELAKESSIIFDIGAYSGVYSLLSAKTNPYAKIYSFEPNPMLYSALKKNVKINKLQNNCTLVNSALSDTTNQSYLYQNAEHHTSQFSLKQYSPGSNKILVSTLELDNYVKTNNILDLNLMKIDAEGFEEHIIRGGLKTFSHFNPILLMEALSDDELQAQNNLLCKFGYNNIFQIPGNEFDLRNYLWIPDKSINVRYVVNLLSKFSLSAI